VQLVTPAKKRFTLDLDPMFQRRLKVMAALKGISMREYSLIAIEKELADDEAEGQTLPFGREALSRLITLRERVFGGEKLQGDSADLIRETREKRSVAE
jgi:hypothetical protein